MKRVIGFICFFLIMTNLAFPINAYAEGEDDLAINFPTKEEWKAETPQQKCATLKDAFAQAGVYEISEEDIKKMDDYDAKDWAAFWTYVSDVYEDIKELGEFDVLSESMVKILITDLLYARYDDIYAKYRNWAENEYWALSREERLKENRDVFKAFSRQYKHRMEYADNKQ